MTGSSYFVRGGLSSEDLHSMSGLLQRYRWDHFEVLGSVAVLASEDFY